MLVRGRRQIGGDRVEQPGELRANRVHGDQDGNRDAGGDQRILMAVAPDSSLTKRAIEVLIFDSPFALGSRSPRQLSSTAEPDAKVTPAP